MSGIWDRCGLCVCFVLMQYTNSNVCGLTECPSNFLESCTSVNIFINHQARI